MQIKFDTYTRRARLQPALLIALPLGLAAIAWLPDRVIDWDTLWGIIVWWGGAALIAQVARDPGKRKERELFEAWGGKPSTRLLRYRDAENRVLVERLHAKLAELVPEARVGSPAEEERDPAAADAVYETWTGYLRNRTRNRERFPLVFEENCNYGFRRNTWGLKPLGTLTAIAGLGAIVFRVVIDSLAGAVLSPIILTAGGANLLLLILWLFWITPTWVRIAADAYAERLLETVDDL